MSFLVLPLHHSNETQSSSSALEKSIPEKDLKKPYQLLSKNQFPEKCAVCKNAAIGYHYNVPSCNGCKTFFRRTILNGKRFICMNHKNCLDEIESDESQRLCKGCRFARCIEVGMDSTAIRASVKTVEGKYLLEEVLRKQKNRKIQMQQKDNFLSLIIKQLSHLEDQIEKLHFSTIPDGFEDMRSLSEILLYNPVFDSSRIPNLTPVSNKAPKLICMTYMHSALLAAVEASKTFEFFSKISHEARMILIRHVSLIGSNMMSASFSMHHRKSDELLLPDGTVFGSIGGCLASEVLGEIKYKNQLQQILHAFLRINVDRVEYMILKAILMRNPSVPGLTLDDQLIIENERNQYAKALLEYTILHHGVLSGPARFGSLIAINPIIETQSKKQKDVYVFMKTLSAQRECSHPPKSLFDEVMDS